MGDKPAFLIVQNQPAWQAERTLIEQVEKHTMDLSSAIQISVERLTSRGRTDEARKIFEVLTFIDHKNYFHRLALGGAYQKLKRNVDAIYRRLGLA